MLNKLFSKALTLHIAGQGVSFSTTAEFEFALAGRTDVPTKKLTELIGLSIDELKREAKNIKAIERQFVDVISKSVEKPSSISRFLREIDPHVFSQDHNWRDIILALNNKDEEYDELRRIALVKYMQYLTSRQDVIKQTYTIVRREQKLLEKNQQAKGSGKKSSDPAEEPKPGLRDTVIFDSVVIEQQTDTSRKFTRLPKGEAINVDLGSNNSFELRLSKHVFRFERGDTYDIVDDQGRRQSLQDGKNIVGRDSVCNIVIDNAYRDVSRLHLLIEPQPDGRIRFTDLSSHGVYLPSHLLVEN